jgi:hypothetical protein
MIVMIKSVIRCPNDMVLVFDDDEEQIPEYQGWYPQVRELILKDAPPDTIFGYWFNYESDVANLPREEW